MDIKVFIILDLLVYKGKIAGDIVSSKRNECDPVFLYPQNLKEKEAAFKQPALEGPQRYLEAGYTGKSPENKCKIALGVTFVVEPRGKPEHAGNIKQRFKHKQREHKDSYDILDGFCEELKDAYKSPAQRRMDDSLFVRLERIVSFPALEFKLSVVYHNLFGSQVDLELFLIVIHKGKIQIHIEGKILRARFPKQQIKPVGVTSRKIALALSMYHVRQYKGNASVFLAVIKKQY